MNIMTGFHLIFVHLIDSKFAHCDDKAESTDDKNDDGNEAADNTMTEMILKMLNFDYLHPPLYMNRLDRDLDIVGLPPKVPQAQLNIMSIQAETSQVHPIIFNEILVG